MKLLFINFLQALRHIRRNRWQSLLIVSILSFAMAAFVFSAAGIWEITHEEHGIVNDNDVYALQASTPGDTQSYTYFYQVKVAETLTKNLPDDITLAMASPCADKLKNDTNKVGGYKTLKVTPEFFEVAQMEFVSGRPAKEEGEVVISEQHALELFGTTDIAGTTVEVVTQSYINTIVPMQVSGVVRGHIEDIIGGYNLYECRNKIDENTWFSKYSFRANRVLVLAKTQNVKALMNLINENNEDLEDKFVSLKLRPIGMFNLLFYEGSFWKAAFYPGIFLILSTLLLISSLFSYLALLISNAESRWTEYRLRFSFGATGDTLRRIYAEVILVFMAIALGTCIVLELCYDSFFKYMQLPECPVMPWMVGVWTSILVVFLILCTIPVYLQNRKYKRAINGAPQGKPSSLNYFFVICQVSASVLLLFLVWNGSRQLHYVSVDALGMKPDRVYTFSFVREDEKALVNTHEVAQEISALAVVDTCITLNPFFGGWGMAPPNSGVEHYQYHMTEAAIKLFEMKPNIWKPMTGEFTLKNNQVLISSNAAEHYGVTPENPYVPYGGGEIIGTLDICTHDLHSDARLIVYLPYLTNSWSKEVLYFRFLPGREKEGIAAVEDLLRKRDINVDAGLVRVVNFGDTIANTYEKEQNYLTLYTILAIVGFGIAFFGLLTLVSADLQRQRRSLAIRRIFGANYAVCLRTTLRTYLIIVALGSIIGICTGYYLMRLWLQTYSSSITLGWVQPVSITIGIVLLVTSLVAWKVRQCFREKPAEVIKA